jgi:HK97 family phage major capsid protein
MLDHADADGKRPLNSQEASEFEGRMIEVKNINKQLEDREDCRDLADLEADLVQRANRPMPTLAAGRGLVTGADSPTGRFLSRSQKVSDHAAYQGNDDSLDPGRAIRGMVTGNWQGAEGEQRAMSASVGSTGGFLLTPSMSGILVDLARNQSVCVQATALMDTSEMVIGRQLTDPTAAWVPEGGTITPTDITFDKVTLRATALAAMCRVSIQLATDAANMDALIRNALSGAIATELDRAALVGTGVNAPLGVTATPDVGSYSMGVNGAAVTNFDPWSHAVQSVRNANGIPNAAVMSPRTAGALDRLKEGTTNAPLTPPASYAGLQKFVSKQISDAMTQGSSSVASASIVGDFTQICLGLAPSEGGQRGIRIDVSRDVAFTTMELYIRAYLRCDVVILRPAWFTVIKGIL